MEQFLIPVVLLFGGITGAVAAKKGQPFLPWFFLGTLLFIVALPVVLLMDDRLEPGMTGCAYCGRRLKLGAMECPKCRRAQPNINAATNSSWERIIVAEDEVSKWAKQGGEGK